MSPDRCAQLDKLKFQWVVDHANIASLSVQNDQEYSSDSDNGNRSKHTNKPDKNVPFVVTLNCSKRTWETQFKKAQAFKKKYGHLQISEVRYWSLRLACVCKITCAKTLELLDLRQESRILVSAATRCIWLRGDGTRIFFAS